MKRIYISVVLMGLFALWTLSLVFIDVRAIGPQNTCVGLASLNESFHNITGVHMELYRVTDYLSIVPIGFAAWFSGMGLFQLITRGKIKMVDTDILAMGVFYILVLITYLLFERYVVNYRPVLINGHLEASYPSSTTMLVICVMQTAIIELKRRTKRSRCRACFSVLIYCFVGFMVAGRLFSGVHWLTDIIGGVLISAALVMLYSSICVKIEKRQ